MKKRIFEIIAAITVLTLTFTSCSSEKPGQIKIHYIDVGQADSILVQSPDGENMLIDAGNNGDESLIINYLKEQKVKRLEYVICTHPHEDHEGGLDAVIDTFPISKLYAGSIFRNRKGHYLNSRTKTHVDVLNAERDKKLTPVLPKPGTVFKMGDVTCTVLAPNSSSYTDLNSFSIVVRMTYKKNSWLFEGDADSDSEKEMLNGRLKLKSDVLKISHHGSDTATSDAFLRAVSPKYTVLSVGSRDNRYKHPHKATMNKLRRNKTPLYRTDENGTIVCISNGTDISFNASPGDYADGK